MAPADAADLAEAQDETEARLRSRLVAVVEFAPGEVATAPPAKRRG